MLNRVRLSDSLCPHGLDTQNFFGNKEFDDQYNISVIYI